MAFTFASFLAKELRPTIAKEEKEMLVGNGGIRRAMVRRAEAAEGLKVQAADIPLAMSEYLEDTGSDRILVFVANGKITKLQELVLKSSGRAGVCELVYNSSFGIRINHTWMGESRSLTFSFRL